MHDAGVVLFLGGAGLIGYTYILYPILLKIVSLRRPAPATLSDPEVWPSVSILLTVRDEAAQIAKVLENLLALDYPKDRRQVVVVSSGAADGTDEIVRAYADRGVELVSAPQGRGQDAANLTGEIVVNTNASVRIPPDGLKALVRPFVDAEVGLTRGREIRVPAGTQPVNGGDVTAMRYETLIRGLETRAGGVVGASGPWYAIRTHLHRIPLPVSMSRDVTAALHCHEWGYRAVFEPDAVCYVTWSGSLRQEYRQRVGTLARGLRTVLHKRQHLNPFRGVAFAWMLFSHEVCRWIVPWAGVLAVVGLIIVAPSILWARALLGVVGAVATLGAIGWVGSEKRKLPRVLELPAFGLMGNVAAMHGALRASRWRPERF